MKKYNLSSRCLFGCSNTGFFLGLGFNHSRFLLKRPFSTGFSNNKFRNIITLKHNIFNCKSRGLHHTTILFFEHPLSIPDGTYSYVKDIKLDKNVN